MYFSKQSRALGFLAIALAVPLASADEFTAPLYDFLSRPDIHAPRLDVDLLDPSGVAPGYIFLTPWGPEIANGINYDFGPAVYDNYGELVWTGFDAKESPRTPAMGTFVTMFGGKPHIGYAHGGPGPIYCDVLDEHYELAQRVTLANTETNHLDEFGHDMHEFNVITPRTFAVEPSKSMSESRDTSHWLRPDDPDTAIITATKVWPVDPPVTVCGVTIEWVRDYPFQEISLDGTNTVLFEWNPIQHIPVDDAVMCPGMADHAKTKPWLQGTESWRSFDYVHRNAIDKLPDGDYVLSARHMSTIYKISHTDGHIIWRFGGGKRTDFNQTSIVPGVEFEFSFQHDVRVANDLPGADPANGIYGLTLWDNANGRYDNVGASSYRSMGKSFLIDENTMTATLISAFALPGNLLGVNQGSHQALPNGNHIIGGGNIAQMAEYPGREGLFPSAEGQEVLAPPQQEPVFVAHFGGGPMNSYRARRHEWHGFPKTKPSAFAYRQSCDSSNRTFVYVSWNGATEVAQWKVFTASQDQTPQAQFTEVATSRRTGFETTIPVQHHDPNELVYRLFMVALDPEGKELGRTDVINVWVPKEDDIEISARSASTAERRRVARRRTEGACNEKRCRRGFLYLQERAKECPIPSAPAPASSSDGTETAQ